MPLKSTGLGKGLREPVSPYRSTIVFGADLNTPNADNWNAIPVVVEPATNYDLSQISENHEVVVAVLGVDRTLAGTYSFYIRWYRERDNKILWSGTYSRMAVAGAWGYVYSYIGWTSQEISENGSYRVEIKLTGAETLNWTAWFTVSGIAEVVAPTPPSGDYMPAIVSTFALIAAWFDDAGTEVKGWTWPFSYLATPLLYISDGFEWLASNFSHLATWVDVITTAIVNVFSLDQIAAHFKTWIDYATNAWNWVKTAWTNVSYIVDFWWASTKTTVQGWIQAAQDYMIVVIKSVDTKLNQLTDKIQWFLTNLNPINSMLLWFKNWANEVWRALTNWGVARIADVTGLVDSAFIERQGLWSGWQDFRDKVASFFSNPLEYIWSLFTDWFLGPEE